MLILLLAELWVLVDGAPLVLVSAPLVLLPPRVLPLRRAPLQRTPLLLDLYLLVAGGR